MIDSAAALVTRFLVFTDLDATLLDHKNYSWQPAAQAINYLEANGHPLILCSSKTLAEMVEEKKINGTLSDGEDLYEITISEVYENTQCFEGTIDLDVVRNEFIFCDGSEKKLDIK